MRKLQLSMMLSLDGYFEGPGHDLSWHVWDDEMTRYMMGQFERLDAFVYGRVSYELMLSYWPQETGAFAEVMNRTPKYVFSRTLTTADWNATIVSDDPVSVMRELKRQPGKDLVLFAGANLAEPLIRGDVIDEYRLIVNPVVLGEGRRLFPSLSPLRSLRLGEVKSFGCGNVLLVYRKPE